MKDKIKRFCISFCVVFTIVTVLCSFTRTSSSGYFVNLKSASYGIDEITHNGQSYIVATTPEGGIAICKK